MEYTRPSCEPPYEYSLSTGFKVRTDDITTHSRVPSADLYRILTTPVGPRPVILTKAGKPAKRQPSPVREQPTGFYQAQVLLYGLNPVKTVDGAKNSLLKAFAKGNGSLTVPKKVLATEERLRNAFVAENEAAKARYGGSGAGKKASKDISSNSTQSARKRKVTEVVEVPPAKAAKTTKKTAATTARIASTQPLQAVAPTPNTQTPAQRKARPKATQSTNIAAKTTNSATTKSASAKSTAAKSAATKNTETAALPSDSLPLMNYPMPPSIPNKIAPVPIDVNEADQPQQHTRRTKQTARKSTGGKAPRKHLG
ncbi:hypothetical protein HK097_006425 [Rhizophlyctis rosea]|uniref:Uncharacterized protein n=1 Tax=Rhizophlyctis rosea TaxID=64517 RepID=A0AAD5SJQ1_9FUNG|nr:hypothetical protein HK097_006425 [Rhizophlyctis rosea]